MAVADRVGIPEKYLPTGPSPPPFVPWQTAQCVSKSARPCFRTSGEAAIGLVSRPSASIRSMIRWRPIASVLGGGNSVIVWGATARPRDMSLVQGKASTVAAPAAMAAAASMPASALRFRTSDLLGSRLVQPRTDGVGLIGFAGNPHTPSILAEPGIVGWSRSQQGQAAQHHEARDRAERSEQNGQLERNDDKGWNRDNRLATGDKRPVERGIDRERETEHAAENSTEEGEDPNGTHSGAESGVDLVIRRRGEGGDFTEPCGANRTGGCGRLRRFVVDAKQMNASHATWIPSRVVSSFSSAIEMTGKFLTNSRKSRKNQANDPAVMAASTQVG